jgi:membrane-associated phospholipid phosphatase
MPVHTSGRPGPGLNLRAPWAIVTLVAVGLLLASALNAGGVSLAATESANQVEPGAGQWKTWLLTSGSQLRRPAPPDRAATKAELKQLKALVSQRDSAALDQIAYWDSGAPAYRWNEITIVESLKNNMNSVVAARGLALVNAAIYDATIAAWDSKYTYHRSRPSQADPSLTTVLPNPHSPSYPSDAAATAGAASAVLAYLFPNDAQSFLDRASAAGQSRLLAGVEYPSDVAAGLDLGHAVGALAIARGKSDGSDAKWTGTVPTEPGHWTGTNPILPLAGTWKTWVLASGSEFRPGPPPAYNSVQEASELAEVEQFARTPKTNADALFWEYGAGGTRGYQFWNDQMAKKLFEYRLDSNPPRAARVYALESIAYYDSGVACWDAKYIYWAPRPFQLDPNFKPLFTTPNHPGYPSAHSCLSSAAAGTLAYLFPRDAASLNDFANQAAQSRIAGGIHFRSDVVVGLVIGRSVVEKVLARARQDGSQ